MCWIGRQQAATSHSQGTTLVGLENFHCDQSWATIVSVSAKIGCTAQTLLEWVKKAEVDSGKRVGVPTDMAEKLKALERPRASPGERDSSQRRQRILPERSSAGHNASITRLVRSVS
jgi:transposase-like protein